MKQYKAIAVKLYLIRNEMLIQRQYIFMMNCFWKCLWWALLFFRDTI